MAEGPRAFDVHENKKDGYVRIVGGSCDDNGSEVIPSKCSSHFVAIFDPKAHLGDRVPETLINVFNLALEQSQSAVRRLVKFWVEKDKVVVQVSELESEQVGSKAEVFFGKASQEAPDLPGPCERGVCRYKCSLREVD